MTNRFHLSKVQKMKCRQELGLAEGFFYVGFVGSFYRWQGVETLIRAAKHVKKAGYPIRYLLVGSGACEAELRQLVKRERLEGDVSFAGWVEYERVPLYIGAFDVCYVSKAGLSSGFSPLKLYEYLACARPVIGSKAEGVTEVIEQGRCGFLFEPNNAEELAQVIVRCFEQRHRLEPLGLSGRELVEQKYSWRTIAQRISTLFLEISRA